MSTSFERAHPTTTIARRPRIGRAAKIRSAAGLAGARILRERGLLFLGGVVAFAGIEMAVINHIADSTTDDRSAPIATAHANARASAVHPAAARVAIEHPAVAPVALALPKIVRPAVAAPLAFRSLDDSGADSGLGSFAYAGSWEHVRGVADGRSEGTSTRSYHAGATATLRFAGREVKLVGITGPTGGRAIVQVDGRVGPTVEFYSPTKHVEAVVYRSPLLARGDHTLSLEIVGASAGTSKRRYVNIDGAFAAP